MSQSFLLPTTSFNMTVLVSPTPTFTSNMTSILTVGCSTDWHLACTHSHRYNVMRLSHVIALQILTSVTSEKYLSIISPIIVSNKIPIINVKQFCFESVS